MLLPRVSDLRHFTRLAEKPFSLLAVALIAVVACVGYGMWLAPRLDSEIASVPVAMLLALVQLLLLLFSGYLLGMALSVFAFGKTWRDEKLLVYTPENLSDPNAYLARLGDKTLPFWMVVASATAVVLFCLQVGAGSYFLQIPNRAYPLVQLRAASPLGQTRAMAEVVQRNLDRYLSPDDLRKRSAELLASDDAGVQAQAAWLVGRLHLISLEPHVRALLSHPDPSVREQAAIAEGQLGVESGILALQEALIDESEESVRIALIVGIGLSRNAAAARFLSQRLPVFSDETRPYALWAIGESEQLCEAERVAVYAAPEYPLATRCTAMESLKKLATAPQLEVLTAVFDGDDPWCELRVWHGRSSSRIKRDFYRIMVSGERLHEKAIDAAYNIADPSLVDWLARIVNDPQQAQLDRKHARRVYDLLDPAYPMAPRVATGCVPTE